MSKQSTMNAVALMKAKGISIKAMATALKMDEVDVKAICDLIDKKEDK